MVRVFIGVMIPEKLLPKILDIQEKLGKILPNTKFVERENLHISLLFIGDVAEDQLPSIKEKMDSVCNNYDILDVFVDKISLIPNENSTRVIALNIVSGELELLRNDISKTIHGSSYPSHITLCRLKPDRNNDIKSVSNLRFNQIKFVVDRIFLMESILQKTGPVYKTLYASFLKRL